MNREQSGAAVVAVCVFLVLAACQSATDDESGIDSDAAAPNVEAMSREHAHDVGTPSGAAGIEPARLVVAETLPYAEVNDELFYGHFVFPADMVEPLPAVIVVHEWWGLNDGVRAMADRLAAEGYIVLAVDLFGGKTAANPAAARELILDVVENPESANENLRQAYAFVRDTAGAERIGSLGWCFGGSWAFNTALLFPDDLDATVIYYGQVTDDPEKLASLNVPILGLFAEDDTSIPVEKVRSFEKTLGDLGIAHEIEIYADVGHAFANPSGNHYEADVAAEAWQRTIAFLDQHLRTESSH